MLGDLSRARIISDLSQAMPSVFLSRRRATGHWQVIDYEVAGIKGKMLSAGPYTDAPPVRIPLHAKGWHAISIGYFAPNEEDRSALIRLKLTSDPCYVRCAAERHSYYEIFERFWKYAELKEGDALELAQHSRGYSRPGALAFIKLIPLDEQEVAALQKDRANVANRRLIAMNDGHGTFYESRCATVAEIQEWIEPYRNTDVDKLFWCVGGGADVVTYPSRLVPVANQDIMDYPRAGDRYLAESMQILMGQGIDPMRVACDYTHSLGIEFHVSQRMEAFACAPPFEEVFGGPIYQDHPEWRCVDRDGTPIVRLSYAYEGLRRIVLDMFHEVAAYGIDGVNLIFNRGAPFLLYEPPLVEGFMAEYGQDPRQLDEKDERWLAYRSRPLTDFMRELRRELDEHHRAPNGNRLQITAHVLNDAETNRFFGLDLATWVKEGLVDALVAYPWRSRSSDNIDAVYFANLCKGSKVKLYIDILPRSMEPKAYYDVARKFYAAGADGLCLWDTNSRDSLWREWAFVQRLGHRDEWERLDPNDTGAVDHRLLTLGGYRLDRYPPLWAY